MPPSRRQVLAGLVAGALAAPVWTSQLSRVFAPADSLLSGDPSDPIIEGLLVRQQRIWGEAGDRTALETLRRMNPEWDLMARTFGGLAMLEVIRQCPERANALGPCIDRLIADTARTLREHGARHFLLPYGYRFRNPEGLSLFADGELLSLITARAAVMGRGRFDTDQTWLSERVRRNMEASPIGHGESYGDECWAFCNAFAAAALRLDAHTSSRRNDDLIRRYIQNRPFEVDSGMMHSEYTTEGTPQDGPEGSSIFLVCTLLNAIEAEVGAAQYRLARTALLRTVVGFGYAREWAPGVRGTWDVDSGPIVPVFEASASASGLSILAAAAFEDREILSALLSSLAATGLPTWSDGALSFGTSNLVGDAVLLFGLVRAARLFAGTA